MLKFYNSIKLILLLAVELPAHLLMAQNWNTTDSAFSGNLGSEYPAYISALCTYNGELIVAGQFTIIDTDHYYNIAAWDGSKWHTLDSGITTFGAYVNALAVFNGNLYAAGSFNRVSGVAVSNIAMWNGSSWSAVGGGVISSIAYSGVNALEVYNGKLYAAGYFNSAGNVLASNIAAWNDTVWSAVDSGICAQCEIYALGIYNNDLYVGGTFDTVGSPGIPVNNIAVYNDTNWAALPGITVTNLANDGPPQILTFTVFNNNLYAGGLFDSAGGLAANNIAGWNGSAWSPLDSGTNQPVRALTSYNGELLAGGLFTSAGDTALSGLAIWNDSYWLPFNGGVNTVGGYGSVSVYAFATYNGNLYVAGEFDSAASTFSPDIAYWGFATGIPTISPDKFISVYPNPTNDYLRLSNVTGNLKIEISGIEGRLILQGNYFSNEPIPVKELPAGLFIISAQTESGERLVGKFVKE